jgi:hypothetical protein
MVVRRVIEQTLGENFARSSNHCPPWTNIVPRLQADSVSSLGDERVRIFIEIVDDQWTEIGKVHGHAFMPDGRLAETMHPSKFGLQRPVA